jgi:L-asparaginase II
MLLACRALALPTAGYLAPDHPLQRRIAVELAAACALDGPARSATDGCSAPTFELPLAALARGWAAIADPEGARLDGPRAAALARLAAAMAAAPEMVAGPGRFTTELARATGGRVLGKEGAEAVYAMAVRGPLPLGVAFKIADGAERARDTVALEILTQLGALSGEEQRALDGFYRPKLRNHAGCEVGEIVAEVELVEA